MIITQTMPINLEQKTKEISKPYTPIDIARVNNQVIRMALVDGEFHWHKHTDEDELFYVYKGKIEIQFRDQDNIILKQGEMFVVPKNTEHCPKSIVPSYVILFEPLKVNTKGD